MKFTPKQLKCLLPLLLFGLITTGAYLIEQADRPLAFVQKFKPSVGVMNANQLQNVTERGEALYNGDTLRTDQNGFALVQFMDKSLAKVKPESQLVVRGEVEGKQNTSTRIGLEVGEIFMNVSDQGAGNFEVASNNSVAAVQGTQFGATAEDYFWVQEGQVQVLVIGTGESAVIQDSTYARVLNDGSIETGDLTPEEIDRRNKEYAEMNENLEPEIIRLRFVDENGQERVLEIKIFENEN